MGEKVNRISVDLRKENKCISVKQNSTNGEDFYEEDETKDSDLHSFRKFNDPCL